MIAWILSLMVMLQPDAPWYGRYADVALAIQNAAEAHPLYSGPDGKEKTAALLIAVAWHESRFDPGAVGDGGHSLGAWQISSAHAPAEELLDPAKAAEHALRLMAQSGRICREKPSAERLRWYTEGGPGCPTSERAGRLSRHRVELGERLFRDYPPSAD